MLGSGAATWFLFFRHHDEEMHAEMAPPPKPPVFVEVPDMLVNLVGAPGERVQYLKVKVVLEVKEEKQGEAIKPTHAARHRHLPDLSARVAHQPTSTAPPACSASRKN